jgi:hypothetical protein
MNQLILNILCEGQTEELFAKQVLKDYLKDFGIVVKTTILITNKKKNIRGGMLNYQQAKNDLDLLIKQHAKKTHETHYFTTMFDFYALPNDFPGYEDAHKSANCYLTINKIEENFSNDVNHHKFIPYIQLHEFEALVFCGLDNLLEDYPDMGKQINNLKKILTCYNDNSELIDNNPSTAPSKRIIKEFELKHHYDKVKSGTFVTDKVGILALKDKCRHFKDWIDKLEHLANIDSNT